jgi:3-hydroxyacyl-[acyl-carrier-protein] dehydratase
LHVESPLTGLRPAVDGRFASFSFVDRITRQAAGRIQGQYVVPAGATRFPASLMAEAVGQLAAWSAMAQLDFAWRPVAGLAGEARYFQVPRAGQTLQLEAELQRCDAEAVAYGGRALLDGRLALELVDCVGPMLPMDEFDAAPALRADFATLLGAGAPAGRFGGVPAPQISDIEHGPGERVRALLSVPTRDAAALFADHFPRRPVFPGTLLLDALAALALQLAQRAPALQATGSLVLTKVAQVKIRSFTAPGSQLQLEAELVEADAQRARFKVWARADGKTVATARVELGARAPT